MTEYAELFERREGILGTPHQMWTRYERAIGLLKGLEFASALDIGCAEGQFVEILRVVSKEVCGIDVSQMAIAEAKRRQPKVDFRVGGITLIPLPSASFDLASCLDVIYYLDDKARLKAVDELARILKPEGYLLISTSWPKGTRPRTGTEYMKEAELLALLQPRFEFLKEGTTSTMLGIPFLRSGVVMLMRKRG